MLSELLSASIGTNLSSFWKYCFFSLLDLSLYISADIHKFICVL
jgi:hypothetical protein